MTVQYQVWYAAAGCLPDSEDPEFEGTLEECEAWVEEAEYDEYAECVSSLNEERFYEAALAQRTLRPEVEKIPTLSVEEWLAEGRPSLRSRFDLYRFTIEEKV